MYPKAYLTDPGVVDALVRRLESVQPGTRRLWGRMTAQQMLCHLADSFDVVTGERPAKAVDTLVNRTLIKWIALHAPLPWPKGVPTGKSVDAEFDGTKPGDFEADRQRVIRLLRRFADPATSRAKHPGFGPLTEREWMLWGFGHVDHHLRQFGA